MSLAQSIPFATAPPRSGPAPVASLSHFGDAAAKRSLSLHPGLVAAIERMARPSARSDVAQDAAGDAARDTTRDTTRDTRVGAAQRAPHDARRAAQRLRRDVAREALAFFASHPFTLESMRNAIGSLVQAIDAALRDTDPGARPGFAGLALNGLSEGLTRHLCRRTRPDAHDARADSARAAEARCRRDPQLQAMRLACLQALAGAVRRIADHGDPSLREMWQHSLLASAARQHAA